MGEGTPSSVGSTARDPHLLADRTALVTGASRGIGKEIAFLLAASGASVALLARTADALDAVAARIGERAFGVPCDVTDSASVRAAADAVRRKFGGAPDIIINNAGLFRVAALASPDAGEFVTTIRTNLIAPFLVLNAFLAELLARGSGHLVTIGSVADRAVFTGNGAYAASKHGLRALHEVLRAELRGSGVRATLVSPSSVATNVWEPLQLEGAAGIPTPDEMLQPGSVAGAVMFALTQPAHVNVDELRLSRS